MVAIKSLAAATLLFAPAVFAQLSLVLQGNLPACAQTCPNVLNPAQSCTGSGATADTAKTCFCNAIPPSFLTPSNVNTCAGTCSDADFATVDNYIKQFCGGAAAAGGSGGGASTTAPAAGGATATNSAGSSASTVPASSGSDGNSIPVGSAQDPAQWWAGHYQWIIMVIVLIVVLTAGGITATVLHRRHGRKRMLANGGGGSMSRPTSDLTGWGPTPRDSVHDMREQPVHRNAGPISDKGKERAHGGSKLKNMFGA